MCGSRRSTGVSKQWCGTGWTGEPAVWEKDGRTWLAFGAYDKAVHVLDAKSGERILPDFPVGDIIKGSVTIDPDGFPILYTGGRDNYYRAIALDRPAAAPSCGSCGPNDVSPTLWNNDWDGSGLVIDDYLFEGGENSQFHIVKLNRAYGRRRQGHGRPQLVFHAPGLGRPAAQRHRRPRRVDRELGRDLGQHGVLRQLRRARPGLGHQRPRSRAGTPTRVFRFWTGDDTDASVVDRRSRAILYVGVGVRAQRPARRRRSARS